MESSLFPFSAFSNNLKLTFYYFLVTNMFALRMKLAKLCEYMQAAIDNLYCGRHLHFYQPCLNVLYVTTYEADQKISTA